MVVGCRQGCTAAEFEGLVQRNMAANCGLDFREFVALLRCIIMRDLEALRASEDCRDLEVQCASEDACHLEALSASEDCRESEAQCASEKSCHWDAQCASENCRDLKALRLSRDCPWHQVFNLQRASFALTDLRGRLAESMAEPPTEPPAEHRDRTGACECLDGDRAGEITVDTTPGDAQTRSLSSVDELLSIVCEAVAKYVDMASVETLAR